MAPVVSDWVRIAGHEGRYRLVGFDLFAEAPFRTQLAALTDAAFTWAADETALRNFIDGILLPRFDRDFAAAAVLGKHWREADDTQKQRFIDAFYESLLQRYADGVVEFDMGRVEILPYKGDANKRTTVVRTQVRRDDGSVLLALQTTTSSGDPSRDLAAALLAALDMAEEGDLLVIFGDDIKRCWKQVAGYEVGESGRRKSETRTLVESFVEEDPEAFRLDADMELIRDERGVRIARLDEESD